MSEAAQVELLHRTKYVFIDMVQKVEEKEFTVGGRKMLDGKTELIYQSAGWHLWIGNVSICVGDIKPDIKAGDKIRMTIERI